MRLVPLPAGVGGTEADAEALYERISQDGIEVGVDLLGRARLAAPGQPGLHHRGRPQPAGDGTAAPPALTERLLSDLPSRSSASTIEYAYPCSARNRCRCCGEVGVDGVAGDHRVEPGRPPVPLRPQQPASRWASSCREPNDPDTWIATPASGRSMEKFATLLTTSSRTSPARKASNSRCRSTHRGLPGDDRSPQPLGQLLELVEVLPDHQRRLAVVPGDQLVHHRGLAPAEVASR